MATTSRLVKPRRARPAAIRRAPPATCPCVSVRPLGPSTRTGRSARSRSCRRMKLEYGTSGMGTSGCGLRKVPVAFILSDMTLVRAAVLVKPKTLEAREFARPTIGPDDGLLRIEACGICGSDYEQYEGAQPPHEDYTPFPVIPGHEPLGVIEEIGANARQRWGVREGDRVAVRAAGQRGLCSVIAARAAGAKQVVITGLSRDAQKLALARELGADATVNAETDDVVARVREITGGGAEVVVDTTPYAPQSLNHAIAIAVRKGRVVVAGLKGMRPARELPVDDVIYKELTIRGVLSMPVDDTFRAIDIIESGRYPFAKMHTYSLPLEQAEDAIHALAGQIPGVNPVHLAIVPGAPRVALGQVSRES